MIRQGVFETNSSSTHSLTMCTGTQYESWKNEQLYMVEYPLQFLTRDELIMFLKTKTYLPDEDLAAMDTDTFNDWVKDNDVATTYETYFDDCDLETFESTYTTPNGETVVAFGKYGYS